MTMPQIRREDQTDLDFRHQYFLDAMALNCRCACGHEHPSRDPLPGHPGEWIWHCGRCPAYTGTWRATAVALGLTFSLRQPGAAPCGLCGLPDTVSSVEVGKDDVTLCHACYLERFQPELATRLRGTFARAASTADLIRAKARDERAFLLWARYKLGDRVRVPCPRDPAQQGQIGTVQSVSYGDYGIDFGDGHHWLYSESDLQAVSP